MNLFGNQKCTEEIAKIKKSCAYFEKMTDFLRMTGLCFVCRVKALHQAKYLVRMARSKTKKKMSK